MTTETLDACFLFVYGSLCRDRHDRLHVLLQKDCDYVGKAHAPGRLYCLGDYPGAVFDATGSDDWIYGEVYRLHHPTATFRQLDDYEECSRTYPEPHEYRRLQKTVTLNQSCSIIAWVYAYNHSLDGLTRIASGDYRSHQTHTHD